MAINLIETNFMPPLITYIIAYTISIAALFIGSITDLKTREVPDWLNYGLIFSGIGLNLLFSAVYSSPFFIINSIVGLAIFFGIAYVMFYAGQWGGGDSKMLMGLGAIIGFNVFSLKSSFLFGFFINALFAGAIYGILWSIFLIFKNKKKFRMELNKVLAVKKVAKAKKIVLILLILLLVLLPFAEFNYSRMLILSFAFLVLATFYLWILVKAVEKSCMYKLVEPYKLTEGDWIVKDILVDGEYVTGPKELGISKNQIKKLMQLYKQKKVKKILIKEGIPFVPSFLIAFVVTLMYGNPLVWFF